MTFIDYNLYKTYNNQRNTTLCHIYSHMVRYRVCGSNTLRAENLECAVPGVGFTEQDPFIFKLHVYTC